MIEKEIFTNAELTDDDVLREDPANRPTLLCDFVGQEQIRKNLTVYLGAARNRGKSVDHILFQGPPGLGKTTLSRIVANEMSAPFVSSSGPGISKPGDLAAILVSMAPGTVFFIDEVHRLSAVGCEMLYTALEDFRIDLTIGDGHNAKAIPIDLPPFTLVAATTRAGMLPPPLLERFGIDFTLGFYETEDLARIIERDFVARGIDGEREAIQEIAARSRGTPRIAKRILRRVQDFAEFGQIGRITKDVTMLALTEIGIDENGLDRQDRAYLRAMVDNYRGGPVGVETMAAALSQSRDTLESAVEPFLVSRGYIARTPRGRVITVKGRSVVTTMKKGEQASPQGYLFKVA